MVLIRVALVGLAADASPQVRAGNWGVVAHLKPLLASPHYELVAVCNSSVESAQKSIDFHGLDASKVKAYGSTKDLAKDPNVDLISVSINVVKHAEATQPLLEAGRNVVVEWPLGTNLEEAEGLTKTAKEKGVRSVVGLQFRADPLLKKVKQMVADGIIGDTRSSVALGCSSILPGDIWIEGGTYFIDMNTGGNEFTIFFGHCRLSHMAISEHKS